MLCDNLFGDVKMPSFKLFRVSQSPVHCKFRVWNRVWKVIYFGHIYWVFRTRRHTPTQKYYEYPSPPSYGVQVGLGESEALLFWGTPFWSQRQRCVFHWINRTYRRGGCFFADGRFSQNWNHPVHILISLHVPISQPLMSRTFRPNLVLWRQ